MPLSVVYKCVCVTGTLAWIDALESCRDTNQLTFDVREFEFTDRTEPLSPASESNW
jgi:hypothetical protein